jgi:DNA repair ATPase RecN
MINQLQIMNFQALRLANLKFDPGVNCIIGQTDACKSGIVRTLKLNLLNKPTGTAFLPIFDKKKKANISVTFDNDKKITRIRGKNTNIYKTNDGLEYEKFGTDPPDEIQRIVNIIPWLNFQFQHDAPFLLSMSGGDAAKALNTIIRMEIIDETVQAIRQDEREAGKKFKAIETAYNESKSEFDALAWVDKADAMVRHLEGFEIELEKKKETISDLENYLDELEEIESVISGIKLIPQNILNDLEERQDSLNIKISKLTQLESLFKELNKIESDISEIKLIPIDRVNELEAKVKALQDKENKLGGIEALFDELITIEMSVKEHERALIEINKEWQAIKPNECPVCGQEVKEWKM